MRSALAPVASLFLAALNAIAHADPLVLDGQARQGSLIFGRTDPGSTARLVSFNAQGEETSRYDLALDDGGRFVIGFDRDHGPRAELQLTTPSGEAEAPIVFDVAPQGWRESAITVAERKVNPYLPADLEKIAADREVKQRARAERSAEAMWVSRFEWPVAGCISSPFGSRRIINGNPRRPHSGVDVAAPDGMNPMNYIGTVVSAPADGIVRLASPGMFFEGGLVLIDHGQSLESALMHLSSVDVAPGTRVRQGDPIGKVGMSGRVTGPHLHWSLKWRDRLLDATTVVSPRRRCTD
ncbi:MAG: M23 family metallopeptidase [Pseudomonadota bacterium]